MSVTVADDGAVSIDPPSWSGSLTLSGAGAKRLSLADGVLQVAPLPSALSVELSFSAGGTLLFRQEDAADLGDYVGPFVCQRCFQATSGPWVVLFRPDADGTRSEVVVELGSRFDFSKSPPVPQNGAAPAHFLTAYTASIKRGNETVATVTVPRHYWGSRWRWQSAPRPLVRTYADLVTMRALPPMGTAAMWGKKPSIRNISYAGPMTPGGLITNMGVSGDRAELGHITEYQAAWLVAGDRNGLASMGTQAEAAGSMSIHIRDVATDAPLDVQAHPYLTQRLSGTAAQKIPRPAPLTYAQDPNYFNTQCAHYPDVAFVPWLLTDDPYLLEECQFSALYHATESDYHQINNKLPGMAQPSETRGWAWGIRDIARMAAFSPDAAPKWLLPKAQIKKNLADCLTFFSRYLASSTPGCAVFHLGTQGNVLSSWMIGYHASILGWMKWSGLFPEWDAAASYVLDVILKLNADPSEGGWDRRWPAPYQLNVLNLRTLAPTGGALVPDPGYKPSQYDANTPTSWKEAFTLYTTWVNAQAPARAFDPSHWTEDRVYENATDSPYGSNAAAPSGMHYVEIQRGCLALAALAGEPGAAAKHSWLASKFPAVLASYVGGVAPSYRYSFWPG